MYGQNCLNKSTICRWFCILKRERSLEDEERSCQPRDKVTERNTICIQNLLAEDVHNTLDELPMHMPPNCNHSSIWCILRDKLEYHKLSGC